MNVTSFVGEIPVSSSSMARMLLTWKGVAGRNGETSDAAFHNGEKLADLDATGVCRQHQLQQVLHVGKPPTTMAGHANKSNLAIASCEIGKYVALQICDDEDVETMIESFQQQQQMSVLELYVEKDVAGGSMFHSANSVTSCGHNLSHHEIASLHDDEDDDDDYLVSNSYAEESLDEDDSVEGISDTDDEGTDIIEPVSIVYQEFKIHFGMMLCIITISIGVIRTRKTFVVWTWQRLLMLDKNYMLARILTVKMR
ncbi:hypothetical protein GmHk_03G007725 [Glycine max]|nr:hypothetical protein GmHk_03G007725 [Glycine max]